MTVIDRAQRLFLRHGWRTPSGGARSESDEVAVRVSTTELSDAIHAAIESFDAATEVGDRTLHASVQPIRVDADPLRLLEILCTLVGNAVRHGGDSITVRTFASSGFAKVEVSDNGRGLDAEESDAIFTSCGGVEPTDLPAGSVGLGLAVSQRWAQRMGGDLVAFREDGLTTFRLCVPLSEPPTSEPVVGD
ncbi:MAG: ATP-binding protein [Acidimicrobiia bacterium]|nr:ATP-binding protein [Acidimicrobiia bacterium]